MQYSNIKKILKNPKKSILIIKLSSNPLDEITCHKKRNDDKFINDHRCSILNYNSNNDIVNDDANHSSDRDSTTPNCNGFYSDDSSDSNSNDPTSSTFDHFKYLRRRSFYDITPKKPQHKYRFFLEHYNRIGGKMSI